MSTLPLGDKKIGSSKRPCFLRCSFKKETLIFHVPESFSFFFVELNWDPLLDPNRDCISLFLFFAILLLHVLLLAFALGTNLLGTLHLCETASMYLFGKNAAVSVVRILNTVFQCSSVQQHICSPRQNFCLYSFMLPSSCLVPCEIQNATCFSLSLPAPSCFWCVGCLVFFKDKFNCTKAIIFYSIGKVIWVSLFLLMGWVDYILPGLSVSAL